MTEVLTQSEINQSITLDVGNTLVVELGSNYTTPYRWTPDTKIGDSAIIRQLSHEFVPPASDALGRRAPDVDVRGHETGDHHHRRDVQQLCGKDAKPGCVYTLTVTVR